MAAAKEAASHGAKVVLFDFVKPSPQGTKWGSCERFATLKKKKTVTLTTHSKVRGRCSDVNSPSHVPLSRAPIHTQVLAALALMLVASQKS
jgi:hypothetical protein